MFIKIDESTIVNSDQVTYFHEKTRVMKLTSGETFRVDPDYVDAVKRKFSMVNVKESP